MRDLPFLNRTGQGRQPFPALTSIRYSTAHSEVISPRSAARSRDAWRLTRRLGTHPQIIMCFWAEETLGFQACQIKHMRGS
jgi:hypothetical protein